MDESQNMASLPPREPRWFEEPWVQGLGSGLIALVPARRYPAWLRQTIMWVPAVGMGTLVASPLWWRSLARSAGAQLREDPVFDEDGGASEEPQQEPADPSAAGSSSPKKFTRRLGQIGGGIAFGALVYGNMRLSFWLDGALERGLRTLRVPAPRVVLALGAGGFAAWTAEADRTRRAEDS